MTLKEIRKFLDNTKMYVNGKSKEIQEKLFSFGYTWDDGDTNICYTDIPFLFIYPNKGFTWGSNMEHFSKHENREITADEILSLELTEPSYRPFKDANECWQEMLDHRPFGWITDGNKHHLISSVSNIFVWLSDKVYYSFEEAFNTYKFVDGTPFGIKEG